MDRVFFKSSEEWRRLMDRVLPLVARWLSDRVPRADVLDMGSTSVPGALTKGDLDVNVRVPADDFRATVDALDRELERHQEDVWSDGFASFYAFGRWEIPVGIHVTAIGHEDDKFAAQIERLRSDPELIAAYNALKQRHEGGPMDEYRQAKWEFIANYLEQERAEER